MIVVDIGNTSIHLAWTKKGKIKKTLKIPFSGTSSRRIKEILSHGPKEIIIACSVVPRISKIFKTLKKEVYFVGKDIKVPIKCLYDKKLVGMDRLVGAYSAKRFFPQARLVLDFGTAVTMDFLSKPGDYQGGIILPGIGSTLKVLSSCAMLPKKIEFKPAKKSLPRTTAESINQGLEEGFSLMLNSLVRKYKKDLQIGPKNEVIITGGDAPLIMPKLDFPCQYEPLLVLKGLVALGCKRLFPR